MSLKTKKKSKNILSEKMYILKLYILISQITKEASKNLI